MGTSESKRPGSDNTPDVKDQYTSTTPPTKSRSFYLSVISICLCVFISTVNDINFASAVPAIAASLNASTSQAYWCSTALLFSQCVAQPICGIFAEIFGRKPAILISLAIFGLASVLAAPANNITWLITARAIEGLGAGSMNVCVNIIVVDLVPPRERAKWSGIVTLSGAFGLLAGVLSGSGSAQSSWRIIFYVNIAIAVVAFTLIVFFLQLPHAQGRNLDKLRAADWSGMAILSGSVAGLIFGIISGGSLYPWTSARIIAPLLIGGIGVVGFVLFEQHVAGRYGLGQPFIPPRLFSSRTAASGYLLTLLHAMILWAVPFYLLYFIHVCASKSLIAASVLLLPALLVVAPSAAIAGIFISRLSHFKYFNLAGFILLTGGSIGLSTLRANPTTGEIIGYQLLIGIGGGMLFPGRIVAVQAAQERMANGDEAEVRMATSLVSFATSLGQAIGIAMGSTALQNAWDTLVSKALTRGQLDSQHIIVGSQAAKATEIISEMPPSIRQVYQDIAALSVARVWYVCIGLGGLGIVAAFLSRNLSLDDEETHLRPGDVGSLDATSVDHSNSRTPHDSLTDLDNGAREKQHAVETV